MTMETAGTKARLCALALGVAGMFVAETRAEILLMALPEQEVLYTYSEEFLHAPIDLNGDSLVDFTIGYDSSNVVLRTERANRLVGQGNPPPDQGGLVQRLPEGFLIGPELADATVGWRSADPAQGYVSDGEEAFVGIATSCNQTSGCSSTWPLLETQRGFVGVEFELEDGVHYGYLDLAVAGWRPLVWLNGWAYESQPETPIVAGARPTILPLRRREVVREGYLRLEWPAEPGNTYRVQRKTSLNDAAWTDLDFVLPALGTSLMVELPMREQAQFFRVVVAE